MIQDAGPSRGRCSKEVAFPDILGHQPLLQVWLLPVGLGKEHLSLGLYALGTEEDPELSAVQFSYSVMSHSLQPHGLQHTRPPCPSPTPGAYSNSCPSSWGCHLTISSSVIPFFSCLLSFPASGAFPMSQFFTSGGQSIGVSASTSVLPMNIQD